MPRRARCLCESGYIHLISRGNGKQIIFEDDQDYYYYIKIMARTAREECVTICSYCLMSNHIHMLVYYSKRENVSTFMKKIGVKYSNYYNKKYERTGHLFQDRYKSELVDTESYFLTVNRYILQNPVKAGISNACNYRWSSYNIYDNKNSFVDASLFIEMIGGYDRYIEFVNLENNDVCMEYYNEKLDDNWANEKMKMILNIESGNEVRILPKDKRDEALRILKSEGLSERQISRITGLGRGTVHKA